MNKYLITVISLFFFLISCGKEGKEGEASDKEVNSNGLSQEKQKELNKKFLLAATNGDIKAVREFIEKGAEVNARIRHGELALVNASANGQHEVVRELLKAKADVNATDVHGNTALLTASLNTHNGHERYEKMIEDLLRAGAKNIKNNKGQTALGILTDYNRQGLVKLLAEYNIKDETE